MSKTFTYTIASEGFFPNFKVDTTRFAKEIRDSAIVTALDSVGIVGGNCVVIFKADLSQADEDLLLSLVQAHSGEPMQAPVNADGIPYVEFTGPRASSGAPRMEVDPRTGDKVQLFSHNFCKKETWYQNSVRHTGVTMVTADGGAGRVWALPTPCTVIDVLHGKSVFEREIRSTYVQKVYVDGVQKTPRPEGDSYDYDMNYATGTVTFQQAQTGVVTIDYSEATTSDFILSPLPKKKLRLLEAELQFSTDASLNDTFQFIIRARVDRFPPLFPFWNQNPLGAPGPYPAGTKLPIKTLNYETVLDLVAESNLAYPLVHKNDVQNPTWRDLSSDLMIMSWQYQQQATIELSDAIGMDVIIRFENHIPATGSVAIATFYAVSEDE